MSTPTCTPAWRKLRARRASEKSPIGSRRSARPSAGMPIASRKPWTAFERTRGEPRGPRPAPATVGRPEVLRRSALESELARVFDICHGCRRCFSLCNAFPTLFDAVDASANGEVAGLERRGFWEGGGHRYPWGMWFMNKGPELPPPPPDGAFSHPMLRGE